MKLIVFISIIFYNFSLIAQTPVVFVESSSRLNVKEKYFGLAKAIVDLNGDFRDDILSTGQDAFLIEVQLNNGLIFSDVYHDTIQKNAYTVNVGDFNNDGYNDFLYSGFYNGVSVYRKQEDMFSFVKSQNNEEILFAQGSSLFDINNDGWLDALMTNDDGLSLTLINDGKGNLVEEELIDFRTVPVSDNSGNYSAIWVDLNQDSRQDLYISKCRAGVTDPEDPRRINTAFINTDSGYIESAKSFRLDLGEQSWCADSGDLDNDGDMDLVVINHLDPHVIMENNGDGTFARHESFTTSGAISTPDLEVSLADFNNDGLLDILITGVKDYLLLNQGDLQFNSNDNPFGFKNASSAAIGDLDNDGYLDCYIAFGAPDSPSVFADETWLNFGGTNNHFKLSLSGTQSNQSGIGSQVLFYGPWGMQTR
ncbi:MAG: VCBS repeat-containing protein, partial [Bacteroidia bacterium]|nr:VCBS repeat-containing protein [Bacteroidia bacterium]